MIILPYKKGLISKETFFEPDIHESFFPNKTTLESREAVEAYLKEFIPVSKLSKDGIAGCFSASVDPHNDAGAGAGNGEKYSVAYFNSLRPIHFNANNQWIRILGECFVVFNHNKTHAVLNGNNKFKYKWAAWMMTMKKGFKFPKTIQILDNVPGVW